MKKKLLCMLAVSFLLTSCGQSGSNLSSDEQSISTNDSQTAVSTENVMTSDNSTELLATELAEEIDNTVATQKDAHADALYAVLASLPEEKPESTLKQSDVECDTLQWLTATYAAFCYHTGRELNLIGGYSDESNAGISELATGLDQSWGIVDRATAIETIAWLVTDGHSSSYNEVAEMMNELGILDCDDTDLYIFLNEVADAENWDSETEKAAHRFYPMMKEIYTESGKNGIDAWDYCRAMQLTAQCYQLSYFTLEESLTIQLAIAQVIQEEYSSWDDWNRCYINGYDYWTYGNSSAASRAWSYEKLTYEEYNPFAIYDFNMPLEKFW